MMCTSPQHGACVQPLYDQWLSLESSTPVQWVFTLEKSGIFTTENVKKKKKIRSILCCLGASDLMFACVLVSPQLLEF